MIESNTEIILMITRKFIVSFINQPHGHVKFQAHLGYSRAFVRTVHSRRFFLALVILFRQLPP